MTAALIVVGAVLVALAVADAVVTDVHWQLTQSAADWFHPNDRGHPVWADAFWTAIQDAGARAPGCAARQRRPLPLTDRLPRAVVRGGSGRRPVAW